MHTHTHFNSEKTSNYRVFRGKGGEWEGTEGLMQSPAGPTHPGHRGVPRDVGLGGVRPMRGAREGLGRGNRGQRPSGY
jgi:hypothetical protein